MSQRNPLGSAKMKSDKGSSAIVRSTFPYPPRRCIVSWSSTQHAIVALSPSIRSLWTPAASSAPKCLRSCCDSAGSHHVHYPLVGANNIPSQPYLSLSLVPIEVVGAGMIHITCSTRETGSKYRAVPTLRLPTSDELPLHSTPFSRAGRSYIELSAFRYDGNAALRAARTRIS